MKGFVSYLPATPNVQFMRRRMIGFILSALLIVFGIGDLFVQGLNLGIDFRGGILLEVKTPAEADLSLMREQVGALDLGEISLQEFGAPDVVLIRIQRQEGDEAAQAAAIERATQALGNEIEVRRQEFVGPQVGQELIQAGLMSIGFALLGILIYIWLRFEWQFAVAAVIALLHDSIATVALFSLTQMEFNLSTVAAVLMIAGYSINDTVVVFDRIREYLNTYTRKDKKEVINMAINSTISRTVITSLTTLLVVGILFFFGGTSIKGFAFALLVGIVVGTYSSVFVATPIMSDLSKDLTPTKAKKDEGSKGFSKAVKTA